MKTFSEYLIFTIVYYFWFISSKIRLSYTVFRYNLSIVAIKCTCISIVGNPQLITLWSHFPLTTRESTDRKIVVLSIDELLMSNFDLCWRTILQPIGFEKRKGFPMQIKMIRRDERMVIVDGLWTKKIVYWLVWSNIS